MGKFAYSLLAFAFLITVSACAPTTQGPTVSSEAAQGEARIQREIAVKELMKDEERLSRVAQPILISNAELCGDDVAPYIGAGFMTTAQANRDFRQAYADLYGVGEQPTVIAVVPNSPAAGKLKTGDIVREINGQPIPAGANGARAMEKIVKNSEGGAFDFIVERKGAPVTASLKPAYACNYKVVVDQSDAVNAAADGKSIHVTTGMMRFVQNDNELALIVGHELAHNSREHIKAKQGNAIIGAILGGVVTGVTGVDVTNSFAQIGAGVYSQSFESEADYVGLYHTARAGYPIEGAPQIWRRMAASNPGAIHMAGTSHPSTAVRFVALEQGVQEIQSKRSAGLRLLPEEKPKQQVATRETGPNE